MQHLCKKKRSSIIQHAVMKKMTHKVDTNTKTNKKHTKKKTTI